MTGPGSIVPGPWSETALRPGVHAWTRASRPRTKVQRPRASILAVVLIGLSMGAHSAAAGPSSRILVMPFETTTRDGRIFWLGEASAVLLADDLNGLGCDAIAREERREAFDRLQVPPASSLTDA